MLWRLLPRGASHLLLCKEHMGPNVLRTAKTKSINCGTHPQIFKYFHADIFFEELCKLDSDARVHTASERIFVQALQATTNRMANWSICRIQEFALFAGPQIYSHRNDVSRMNIGAIPARPHATRATDLFGWLQCSHCSKWRRVSAPALRIWGDKFHETHKSRCKILLQGDAVLQGLATRAIPYDDFVQQLRE